MGFCIANPLPAALLVVQAVIFNRVARTIAATFSGRRRRR
ncbi:hypothetical protein PAI11_00540 [Patulibacter medicamentivorans]|uniref:Uncharacterized protein n=1 Tax=Patulibacter medicamentivorans TaxID=1097667 RepID=H0DZU9_9ACTN|nr:hypothetical protein PAI11_00540 [Patulibacter medicamentivorans]